MKILPMWTALCALLFSGCAAMIPETFTVTPGASTSQEIVSGKRIVTAGGTVSFTWRIPRPDAPAAPSPRPVARQAQPGPIPARGTSVVFPPVATEGDTAPAPAPAPHK